MANIHKNNSSNFHLNEIRDMIFDPVDDIKVKLNQFIKLKNK